MLIKKKYILYMNLIQIEITRMSASSSGQDPTLWPL